jgi:hypothetical protein
METATLRVMAMQGEARGLSTGMKGVEGVGAETLTGHRLQEYIETETTRHAELMRGGVRDWGGGVGNWIQKYMTGMEGVAEAASGGRTKGVAITGAALDELRKHPRAGEAMSLFLEAKSWEGKDPKRAARLRADARQAATDIATDPNSGLSKEAKAALTRFSDPSDPQGNIMTDVAAGQGMLRVRDQIEAHKQTISMRMSRMRDSLGAEGRDRLEGMSSKNEVAKIVTQMMGAEGQSPEAREELYKKLATAAAKDPTGAASVQRMLQGVGGAAEMTATLDVVAAHKGLAEAKIGDVDRLKRYMGGIMGLGTVDKPTVQGLTTGKWGKGGDELQKRFKTKLKEELGYDDKQVEEFMRFAGKGATKQEIMERAVRPAGAAGIRTLNPEATKRFEEYAQTITGKESEPIALMKRQIQILQDIKVNTGSGDEGFGTNEKKGKGPNE